MAAGWKRGAKQKPIAPPASRWHTSGPRSITRRALEHAPSRTAIEAGPVAVLQTSAPDARDHEGWDRRDVDEPLRSKPVFADDVDQVVDRRSDQGARTEASSHRGRPAISQRSRPSISEGDDERAIYAGPWRSRRDPDHRSGRLPLERSVPAGAGLSKQGRPARRARRASVRRIGQRVAYAVRRR